MSPNIPYSSFKAYEMILKHNHKLSVCAKVRHIPELVLWICGGHRCELSRLCTPWPAASRLDSTPCRRSGCNQTGMKRMRDANSPNRTRLSHFSEAVWTAHLVLVSFEDFDLLCALQVPQSDREVVGRGHQQSFGQRMELDGVNLFCVA